MFVCVRAHCECHFVFSLEQNQETLLLVQGTCEVHAQQHSVSASNVQLRMHISGISLNGGGHQYSVILTNLTSIELLQPLRYVTVTHM